MNGLDGVKGERLMDELGSKRHLEGCVMGWMGKG